MRRALTGESSRVSGLLGKASSGRAKRSRTSFTGKLRARSHTSTRATFPCSTKLSASRSSLPNQPRRAAAPQLSEENVNTTSPGPASGRSLPGVGPLGRGSQGCSCFAIHLPKNACSCRELVSGHQSLIGPFRAKRLACRAARHRKPRAGPPVDFKRIARARGDAQRDHDSRPSLAGDHARVRRNLRLRRRDRPGAPGRARRLRPRRRGLGLPASRRHPHLRGLRLRARPARDASTRTTVAPRSS